MVSADHAMNPILQMIVILTWSVDQTVIVWIACIMSIVKILLKVNAVSPIMYVWSVLIIHHVILFIVIPKPTVVFHV